MRCWLGMLVWLAVACQAVARADSFTEQRDELETKVWVVAKRDDLVREWRQFIAKYEKHPDVAEAMIAVGHLMECDDQQRDPSYKPDRVAALSWFRRAAKHSNPGTDLWVRAQFLFVWRLYHTNQAESREILKQIAATRKDSLTLIRVENTLASVCVAQGDKEAALRHYKAVLNWYKDDPARMPEDYSVRRKVDMEILGACGAMTQQILVLSESKQQRADRIRQLLDEHTHLEHLQVKGEAALKQLENMPEHIPEPSVSPAYTPSASGWGFRLLLTTGTVAALSLLGLGFYVHVRRRQARSAVRR